MKILLSLYFALTFGRHADANIITASKAVKYVNAFLHAPANRAGFAGVGRNRIWVRGSWGYEPHIRTMDCIMSFFTSGGFYTVEIYFPKADIMYARRLVFVGANGIDPVKIEDVVSDLGTTLELKAQTQGNFAFDDISMGTFDNEQSLRIVAWILPA